MRAGGGATGGEEGALREAAAVLANVSHETFGLKYVTEGHSFRETIRTINGPLECEGGNPRQMNNRVKLFRAICEVLGVDSGDKLTC